MDSLDGMAVIASELREADSDHALLPRHPSNLGERFVRSQTADVASVGFRLLAFKPARRTSFPLIELLLPALGQFNHAKIIRKIQIYRQMFIYFGSLKLFFHLLDFTMEKEKM